MFQTTNQKFQMCKLRNLAKFQLFMVKVEPLQRSTLIAPTNNLGVTYKRAEFASKALNPAV